MGIPYHPGIKVTFNEMVTHILSRQGQNQTNTVNAQNYKDSVLSLFCWWTFCQKEQRSTQVPSVTLYGSSEDHCKANGVTCCQKVFCSYTIIFVTKSPRRPPHRKKCTRTANCFIGRHPATGSTFTRDTVSSRTIRRRLVEGHLTSRCPSRVLPLTPTHRRLRLEWCRARGNQTAAEWNQVVFSDESRFNLSSDDNRVHVCRPRDERLNPAFVYSHTPLPQLV
ncbi:transposable element Tcb2 transposase [Trichonephila clavipes]|uniref:Transposable element Tcb2 transposase n=1 Tax=Trichonephila clavipes TaxID=2585209 RepID=A0A8X6RBS9_TRICX|nr:transposable element Tcb2 transposase [Trichonephila clavipes]